MAVKRIPAVVFILFFFFLPGMAAQSEATVQNLPLNLCPDGDFESGIIRIIDVSEGAFAIPKGKWHLSRQHRGSGWAVVENRQAHIKTFIKGVENWDVELCIYPIEIEYGKSYRLTFNARSSSEKIIYADFVKIVTWNVYSGYSFNIDTDMKTYSYEFMMKNQTDTLTRLSFELSSSTDDVWISNVRVEKISD